MSELRIDVESWRVAVPDSDKSGDKKIVGKYRIMAGASKMADQAFNDGYGTIDVSFPAALMAEVEAINSKIKKAIANHFGLSLKEN